MKPFITFRDNDKEGNLQYYILQRDFPHFIGVISSVPVSGTWQHPIAGHHLWVVFNGTLRGNSIPNYRDISVEIDVVLSNMAVWFHAERILLDEKRFKKFKIQPNVQASAQ